MQTHTARPRISVPSSFSSWHGPRFHPACGCTIWAEVIQCRARAHQTEHSPNRLIDSPSVSERSMVPSCLVPRAGVAHGVGSHPACGRIMHARESMCRANCGVRATVPTSMRIDQLSPSEQRAESFGPACVPPTGHAPTRHVDVHSTPENQCAELIQYQARATIPPGMLMHHAFPRCPMCRVPWPYVLVPAAIGDSSDNVQCRQDLRPSRQIFCSPATPTFSLGTGILAGAAMPYNLFHHYKIFTIRTLIH